MTRTARHDTAAQSPLPQPLIEQILHLFEAGDPALLALFAEDIDFRIDHYRDDTDVTWQQATSLSELAALLQRLGQEVFSKGTRILDLATTPLGAGWAMTRFEQQFYYAVQARDVTSLTYILSHEDGGKLDYFRETVTTVIPV